MLKQYDILTRCLMVINTSVLPHIEKLKLEIQLILLKQLLLKNPVETRLRGVPQSEAEFDEIFAEIEEICSGCSFSDTALRLTVVTAKLKRMTDQIKLILDIEGEPDDHTMQKNKAVTKRF